jgi:hypothetical protein
MVVAMAAPSTPRAGTGPKPKIRIGSSGKARREIARHGAFSITLTVKRDAEVV